MKKNLPVIVLYSLCALLALCVFGFGAFFYLGKGPLVREGETVERVSVPSGTGVKAVASVLYQKHLIKSPLVFYLSARFPFLGGRSHPFVLKSGVYSVSNAMSVSEILDLLESGQQEYIRTVIPEGLTMRKIGLLLEELDVCALDDFLKAASNAELLSKYSIPADTFEGYLFPDTYFFTPKMSGTDVVSMMTDNFFSHIREIPECASFSSRQLHDTIILASIVEREYRVESEAPLIASVFKNRLEENVGFYSCATIEYIITELQGRPHPDVITYDDLQIDSPYNTYKWAGLTPGPISNPGMVAISACVKTPKTNYFYFTLTDAQEGRHTFTKSFDAHISAGSNFKTKKAANR